MPTASVFSPLLLGAVPTVSSASASYGWVLQFRRVEHQPLALRPRSRGSSNRFSGVAAYSYSLIRNPGNFQGPFCHYDPYDTQQHLPDVSIPQGPSYVRQASSDQYA